VRTNQFRYVEWRKFKSGRLLERELYDHGTDPGENVNVISDPRYARAIAELEQVMKHGWKGARP
jgi:iduronate 2-sulfatase